MIGLQPGDFYDYFLNSIPSGFENRDLISNFLTTSCWHMFFQVKPLRCVYPYFTLLVLVAKRAVGRLNPLSVDFSMISRVRHNHLKQP